MGDMIDGDVSYDRRRRDIYVRWRWVTLTDGDVSYDRRRCDIWSVSGLMVPKMTFTRMVAHPEQLLSTLCPFDV